jgi:hypothetical protein
MKKFLILLTCVLGALTVVPSADAGYRRTVMGYDSRGNPIYKVVWVADHLDYPRTVYDRRTYSTSVRRDPSTLLPWYASPSLDYVYPAAPSYTPAPTYETSANYESYER